MNEEQTLFLPMQEMRKKKLATDIELLCYLCRKDEQLRDRVQWV